MGHGEKFKENGHEYMEDYINGTNWHIPEKGDVLDKNGNWKDDADND